MGTATHSSDAVMLIGFGGPENHAEIRPFLDRVLQGRAVPRERYEAVVQHYEQIGGRSPYNDLTHRQALALQDRLKQQGHELPVAVGMRNAAPFLRDALADLARAGVRRVAGFVLSAFQCEASWDRYLAEVEAARSEIGSAAPKVVYPKPWHDNPRFIAAVAGRIEDALQRLQPNERAQAELIFTAHSVPSSMARNAPYEAQLQIASRLSAKAVGIDRWHIAWQSRSGSPRESWLEPSLNHLLARITVPVVVVPIGFLCDHVEVLYDLDIEARALAERAGIRFERAATVGETPEFIGMIADVVTAALR